MKKIFIIILLCFATFSLVKAQLYTGINGKTGFSLKKINPSSFEIGSEFIIGYSFNQKLDFDLSISKSWFPNSALIDYKQLVINANCKYIFLENTIRPYVGLGGGFFQELYPSWTGEESLKMNGIGIKPSVGILFKTNFLDGLYINTEISYTEVIMDNPFGQFGLNLGLKYYFI